MEMRPLSVIAGLDPAIQVCDRAARRNLDHRVSPLRVGSVMTVQRSVENEASI
jgi:hypothetical protein